MDQHVIPECFIDTRLVRTLEPPAGRYNHQHGCSNVEKAMKRLKGDFALGIIDKDKKALRYLDECQLICEHAGFSQLLKHNRTSLSDCCQAGYGKVDSEYYKLRRFIIS